MIEELENAFNYGADVCLRNFVGIDKMCVC